MHNRPLLLALLGFLSSQTTATPVLTPRDEPPPFDPSTVNIPPMLRFECSQLVIDRLDPLVNPGLIPSPHLHQIVGGDSFNATLSHDLVTQSRCTTCVFSEDFSNYWTAVMYFRARNGTYKRVPQGVSEGLKGKGGITVYYIPPYDGVTEVTAFRPGFRMLVGDATLRSEAEPAKRDQKVCHRCMPATGDYANLNCAEPDRETFPSGFCAGGIRSVITFPTCWDGVNLDSADHKSHVAYPVLGDIMTEGAGICPESHPVKIPQVMFEVIWNTTVFNDKDLWPEDGSQPFVWSTGDANGFSQHGDYVFGWKGDSLQRAMKQSSKCFGDTCNGVLERQTDEQAMACFKDRVVEEDVDEWLTELPGTVS